jgi:hypothetical protein
MIDESSAVLPLWMLLSATFGFMIGEAFGGQARLRKYLEQANEDLRDQLQKAHPGEAPSCQELHRLRGVIHDIHKHVVAVSKGLEKRPS